ncbi:MAG TPA: hypothetical protein VK892_21465 [Pyrinomonadaceae bacterium]|nr:hypothetical protein [Pyrinomonadaceae bacterium]
MREAPCATTEIKAGMTETKIGTTGAVIIVFKTGTTAIKAGITATIVFKAATIVTTEIIGETENIRPEIIDFRTKSDSLTKGKD